MNPLRALFSAATTRSKSDLSKPSHWLREALGVADTSAGVSVSERNSLSLSAVWAANRVISTSVAQLPLKVYRSRTEGGKTIKEEVRDHPLYGKLQTNPNSFMTSSTWREVSQTHLNLWGNAYSKISKDTATGRPTSFTPWLPEHVEVSVQDRSLIYTNTQTGEEISDDRMIHVPGFSFDGLVGKSHIKMTREAIANGMAAQEYGNRFYGKGANPAGILKTDQVIDEDKAQRVKKSWQESNSGVNKSHGTPLLPFGLEYQRIEIPPGDAQFIESRQFSVKEIARIFYLPPHMLMDLENANYSNIVEQDLAFVKYTLDPWLKKWEQELNRKLLLEREKEDGLFIEFNVDGLLRGDILTRTKHYKAMLQTGVYTPNEVRAKENMNAVDWGDEPMIPNQDPTGDTDEREDLGLTEGIKHRKNGHATS